MLVPEHTVPCTAFICIANTHFFLHSPINKTRLDSILVSSLSLCFDLLFANRKQSDCNKILQSTNLSWQFRINFPLSSISTFVTLKSISSAIRLSQFMRVPHNYSFLCFLFGKCWFLRGDATIFDAQRLK